jgi:hypothetical protein
VENCGCERVQQIVWKKGGVKLTKRSSGAIIIGKSAASWIDWFSKRKSSPKTESVSRNANRRGAARFPPFDEVAVSYEVPSQQDPQVISLDGSRSSKNDDSDSDQHDDYSDTATMYAKEGIYQRPERIASDDLDHVQAARAEDRYYAKERMKQPQLAIGFPQRIEDLERKNRVRSAAREEQDEDHQR